MILRLGILAALSCAALTLAACMGGSLSGAGGYSNMRGFKSPETITHPNENYRFTMPQGWGVVTATGKRSDQLENMDVKKPSFVKVKVEGQELAGCNFTITMAEMKPPFDRSKAVTAAVRKDQARVKKKELQYAKTRDQQGPDKRCSFMGWEIYEEQKADPTQPRSIIYQGYNQDNKYFVFNATCSSEAEYQNCKMDIENIIESIDFCVR